MHFEIELTLSTSGTIRVEAENEDGARAKAEAMEFWNLEPPILQFKGVVKLENPMNLVEVDAIWQIDSSIPEKPNA